MKEVVLEDTQMHRPKRESKHKPYWKGLFIVLKDADGNLYEWMPAWEDLDDIMKKKKFIESYNKKAKDEYEEKKWKEWQRQAR